MTPSPVSEFFDRLAPNWDKDNNPPSISLLEKAGIKEGDKVLDVACGSGIITSMLHSLSKTPVLGIDISEKMIEKAKENHKGEEGVNFLHQDFCEYDGKHEYDVVVIYNAYPHFVHLDAFKKALLKALKSSGKAAILHSLSRNRLNKHHEGLSHEISRDIASPEEEAKFFYPEFQLVLAEESDSHYCLILEKR